MLEPVFGVKAVVVIMITERFLTFQKKAGEERTPCSLYMDRT